MPGHAYNSARQRGIRRPSSPKFQMIEFRFTENARWYMLGLALAGALVSLALLQCRSNRQLRDVLQTQMRSNVQGSLMNMRFGLEQELSPICNAIQSWGTNPGQSNLEFLADQVDAWRGSAVHPALIKAVFFYDVAPGSVIPRFVQLKPGHSQLAEAEWPTNLLPLQTKVNELSDQAWNHHQNVPFASWLIDENVPALVHPVRSAENFAPEAFVIVQLNADELAHHILPELAQRYLGSNGHLDYQVALINVNAPRSVVYSSDSGFGNDGRAPDAQLNVSGPPMADHGGPPAGMFPSASRPAGISGRGEPGPKQFNEPRPPSTGPSEPPRHEPGPLRLQAIRYSPDDKGWTLIARHRKGSVEAAVASVYHRNLAVSFGVLVVLTATIVMVVMTTRRARRLAQLKMDFVTSVSHELRTPLTGIVMAAQNVADGLVDNREPAKRYGAAILGKAQQLSELIEQILLFSATEKGGHQYYFQWVDVLEVIETALNSSASLIRSSAIHVERAIEPELPQIWADYKALNQCLQNLLMNSIKYGGEDRWIRIRTYRSASPALGKEVVIAVQDHGIGIAPDEMKKIFEPFYRSPAVTSAQIHGSGLGLSIVQSMIEAIGGQLTVESELGKGSIFSVHLPAEKQSGPSASASERPQLEVADRH
jgi:signal transduction histidine kinase